LQHSVTSAGLKRESFGACRHSPSDLQRLYPPSSVEETQRVCGENHAQHSWIRQ
jgi:hypothetical protein